MPPRRDAAQRARARSGAIRFTLEHRGAAFPATIDAEGLRWPEDAAASTIAEHIQATEHAAGGAPTKLRWAAFAYQAHLPTPIISSRGPAEIDAPPLRGALSFGASEPASGNLGQLLTNFDYELAKASTQSFRPGALAEGVDRVADSRRLGLMQIEDALSQAIDRSIHFEFPFGQHSPKVLIDGEEVSLALLGEGLRSTLAWLSDLLVRLLRAPWADTSRSPLEQDFWLILDAIDEGLHPLQQGRLLPILRRLFPNARLYVATHSPFLVASAGCGVVFSLRPNARRRVSGALPARRLEPGQSLEWVVEEVFGAETGFIDPWTRAAIAAHRLDINRLRRKKEALTGPEWDALFARRATLLRLGEEVQSLVAMIEVPVRAVIDERTTINRPPPFEGGA
jgi:hypothetical protein